MPRQGNRSQTKEMEDKKLLDIEFKSTLIRFFKNFLEKIDKTYEDMKRDQLELIRNQQEMIKDQQEIKNTLSEIKNIIQQISWDRFGSMDRASAWGLKGPGFDSGQRYVPWLWAYPQ